jgi:hypothetical protein
VGQPMNIQGVSDEMYLFYFDITFFWKSILNSRLLENNELICPFYACFFVFEKKIKKFEPNDDLVCLMGVRLKYREGE